MKGKKGLAAAMAATMVVCGMSWGLPSFAQESTAAPQATPGAAPNGQSQSKLDLAAAKAERKALIGENMDLTPAEGKKFWPLYDRYEAAMDQVDKRHAAEIRAYAKAYQNMTGADAKAKLDEVIAVQQARLNVQKQYIPKFRAAISEIKTTRFFQIDNKLHALIQCQIAQLVPLIGSAQPTAGATSGQ
ncbi:MAG: hypothetical protein IVW54_13370 [Candidatus Binataceae bacterium]|nr:hypothetical protein [Candidatus Binataceae bacterium]